MPRTGTLVICVQNLDFSGANQVVLNIVMGKMHQSNVVVLSPKIGSFAARFVDSGAAVRVGNINDLLNEIRDVFAIICNTIMTAPIVVEMTHRPHPVVWILHEWWDDEMIVENLRIRNYQGLTLNTVKIALAVASNVVFVCESQRQLYKPTAPSTIIFVGVPDPLPNQNAQLAYDIDFSQPKSKKVFTFLCLGIICPRKNQMWTVELFKKFAEGRDDVKLKVVGARYTRVYEMEYLDKLRKLVGDDPRIEIHDVTDNVEPYYLEADCLILTSLNEVTPMVISEALSWSIPVLSTNIAGIKEMYVDGQEGYLFAPDDNEKALFGMEKIYSDSELRRLMSINARKRYEHYFDLDLMVENYRQLLFKVAPPVILLDMDGALVDWDGGFKQHWNDRSAIDRSKSYYMERCFDDPAAAKEAEEIFMGQGFFENLPPMEGSLQAVKEMEEAGLKLYICTSPIKMSKYCAQEKLNWVLKHLGESWLNKVILCQDKTAVIGDVLIDDKPMNYLNPGGYHTIANWTQLLFDAPYNRVEEDSPRLTHWKDWKKVLYPLIGIAFSRKEVPYGSVDEMEELEEEYAKKGRKYSEVPDMPQFKKKIPKAKKIGKPKLERDSSDNSTTSITSGMSAADIQKGFDMLHTNNEPLSPEDMASILSNSMSLIMGDKTEEDFLEEQLLNDTASEHSMDSSALKSLQEKKKQLKEKLMDKLSNHKKDVDTALRKMVLNAEDDDDGLQLFRKSYNSWMEQNAGKKNGKVGFVSKKSRFGRKSGVLDGKKDF